MIVSPVNALLLSRYIEMGDLEKAKSYLDQGISPDAIYNQEKTTALHTAAAHRNSQAIKLLLKYNANPNVQKYKGETPLYFAVFSGGFICSKLLLEHNANPNIPDNDGLTPLHLAACYPNMPICQLLIKHNANLFVKDKDFDTPYDLAIQGYKYADFVTWFAQEYIHKINEERLQRFLINQNKNNVYTSLQTLVAMKRI